MNNSDFQNDKITDVAGLTGAIQDLRGIGKTLVLCHGCFDVIHSGHIRFLEFARRQGDVLIVSIAGDGVSHDSDMPYVTEQERAKNLAQLGFVDFVVIEHHPGAKHILEVVKPEFYILGKEFESSQDSLFLAEKKVIDSYGGKIIFSSGETVFTPSANLQIESISKQFEQNRLNNYCQQYDVHSGSIENILSQFKGMKVLVVGDIVIDKYVYCDALGVANESPMISLSALDEQEYLGGAAIVARHIASLGARPILITAGTNDHESKKVTTLLESENVFSEMIPARNSIVTKTRFLVGQDKLLKVDKAESVPLDSQSEKKASMILENFSREVDAVIFCDFGYGMITGGLLNRTLPTLRHNINTMVADVSGNRATLKNFKHVDLLCPTEREIRTTFNDFESGISAVAWRLLHETQAKQLIVTLEERGMIVFERPGMSRSNPQWEGRLKGESLPSFADHVIDRLGCGDALLAASTLSLAAGGNLHMAAYLGNVAAAIEIGKLGNHPVGNLEMKNWIDCNILKSMQSIQKNTSEFTSTMNH